MSARESAVSCLITAEHASNRVPAEYCPLFAGAQSVLESHRAWDPGTREFARELAQALNLPLLEGRVTRLLVDLNRSASHPRVFSEFSRSLPEAERAALVAAYWRPHWQAFRQAVEQAAGRLVHIACHSFTPVLDGQRRDADIGLLYDPARWAEQHWCRHLAGAIRERFPGLRVRMNYPYRGTSNGLGQQHRRCFPAERLLTMELEVSAALADCADWSGIRQGLVQAIGQTLGDTSRILEAVTE